MSESIPFGRTTLAKKVAPNSQEVPHTCDSLFSTIALSLFFFLHLLPKEALLLLLERTFQMNKVPSLNEASSVTPSLVGHLASSEATRATRSVLPYPSMDGESANEERSSSSYNRNDRHRGGVGTFSSAPSPSTLIASGSRNRDAIGLKIPPRSLDDDYFDEGVSRMSSIDPLARWVPEKGILQQVPHGSLDSHKIVASTATKTRLTSTTTSSSVSNTGQALQESSPQPQETSPTSSYPLSSNSFGKTLGPHGSPTSGTTPFSRTPAWLLGIQVPPSHQQEYPLLNTSLGAPHRQLLQGNTTTAKQPNDNKNYRNYVVTSSTTTGSLHSLLIKEEEEAMVEAAAIAFSRTAADGCCRTEDLPHDKEALTHEMDYYSESSCYVDDDYTDLESVDTENPQVIAIGIEAPTPRSAPMKLARDIHQQFSRDASTAIVMNRKSPEQLQQELLSEATAKGIAQEEHNLKMQLIAADKKEHQSIRRRSAPALLACATRKMQTPVERNGTGSQQSIGRQHRGPGPSAGKAASRFSFDGVRTNVLLGSSYNPFLQSLAEDDALPMVREPVGPAFACMDKTDTSFVGCSSDNRASCNDNETHDHAIADGINYSAVSSHMMVRSSSPTMRTMNSGSRSISSVSYDESAPTDSADLASSEGFFAVGREVEMQSVRGAVGAKMKRQHRVIPRPSRSHSITSTAPPMQPIRKLSDPKPTVSFRDEDKRREGHSSGDFEEGDESMCGPPSLRSIESVQSTQSMKSNTSGIDLDEKTRERILARSAASLQARRPRRTLTCSYSSSSSSTGRDSLVAIANSIRMRASSLTAVNATESPKEKVTSLRKDTEAKSEKMHSPSMSCTIASSLNHRSTELDKPNMSISFHESSAVATTSTTAISNASGRPCDAKAEYRQETKGVVPINRRAHGVTSPFDDNKGLHHLASGSRDDSGTRSEYPDIEEEELPFGPVTTSDVGSYDERNRMELLEAQSGVPVLLPGAFAVGGSNDDAEAGGYDSGFEDGDSLVDDCLDNEDAPPEHRPDIESPLRTASLDPSAESNAPLEAELYVEEFVSAEVLIEADAGVKGNRRPTVAHTTCLVCIVVIIVGIVVGVMIPKQGERSGSLDQNQTEGEEIPVLDGWLQVGETLEGPAEKDRDTILFGESVAISADGSRIAVGLPGAGDPLNNALKRAGSVKIFDLINGTTWEESGMIDGEVAGGESGTNVALADDGKRIAISAPSIASSGDGYVAIYEEINVGSWELVGDILRGGETFGDSLDFSSDGRIVAIGDKNSAGAGDGAAGTGVVRIFQEVNNTWVQMGSDLSGGDQFGWSIALSGDGHRIVTSTPESKTSTGIIQAFDFNGESWEKIGSPVKGETEKESFGVAIALSGDGSILASGAPRYSRGGQGLGPGIVRSFQFDDDLQAWFPYGQPLEGANQLDVFGSSLSLSFTGDVLAVGGPQNNNFCENCGHVQVFQNQKGNWSRIGSELGNGEMDGGQYGSSVALSWNGTRLVGGAPSTTHNGYLSKIGQVVVFDNVLGSSTEG